MRAAIIANANKCHSTMVTDITIALESAGYGIAGVSYAKDAVDAASLRLNPDFAVVAGGDGTIISACRHYGYAQVPILGINLGKLGYLAHFSMEEFVEFVENRRPEMLLARRFISERMLLSVQLGNQTHLAVNDLVVDIGPPFRTAEIEIKIDGGTLPVIRGDGVIIATPTGSTAYTLSAGGSIIHPEVEGIAVTPKNPHRLSFRPLVVRNDSSIVIDSRESEGVYFIVDGQYNEPASKNKVVRVSRFSQNLNIVTREDYWTTLTKKLSWGC